MGVAEWFNDFCNDLRMGSEQKSSFAYRTARIVGVLNADFRGIDSATSNRFYVGSMGRNTAIPSVSDVDLLYVLPYSTYERFNAYTGNKQSALLSAVRASIQKTYSVSDVFGDGQVVGVNFTDGVTYEVLPAFSNTDGGYTFADTNSGGSWKACKPKQEMEAFSIRNTNSNDNLVELGCV